MLSGVGARGTHLHWRLFIVIFVISVIFFFFNKGPGVRVLEGERREEPIVSVVMNGMVDRSLTFFLTFF
jgi:hypothetical protein